jgi:membrane-associated phospholipid phosphatase
MPQIRSVCCGAEIKEGDETVMKKRIVLILIIVFMLSVLTACSGSSAPKELTGDVTIQEWLDCEGAGDDFTVTVTVAELVNPYYARVEDATGSVLLYGLWENGEPKAFAEKEIGVGDTIVVGNPAYNVYENNIEMKEGVLAQAPAGNVFHFEWEMRLMEWLQAHIGTDGFVVWLLSNLSAFGEQLLLVVIMGFLYWGLNKEFGKYVGLNVLMANVWNPMVKNLALRLRPYLVPGYKVNLLRKIDADASALDIAAQGYSFPSGHSCNAVTVYGSLAAHEKKRKVLWIIAIVLPLLVGFSRVFVGAHFPTDVLCGWLLGVIIVLLIPWLKRKIKNRWLFYGVLLLTTVPGLFFCISDDYFSSFGMLLGFLIAEPFEERFVKFENTKNILRCILRTIGGGLVYFGLSAALKVPFGLIHGGPVVTQLLRMLRYAIVIFTVIGVYPMLFKLTDKLWNKIFRKPQADAPKQPSEQA